MQSMVAVFEQEQKLSQAVEALIGAGLREEELQIIAKDGEHSRRIEAESPIHADELRELARTEARSGSDGDEMPIAPLGIAAGTGFYAGGAMNGMFPFAAAALLWADDDAGLSSLNSLGLNGETADKALDKLRSGSCLLVVKQDPAGSKQADTSRTEQISKVLREQGAHEILQ